MLDKINLRYKINLDTSKFSGKFKHILVPVAPSIDSETGEILHEAYTIDKYIYRHNGLRFSYSRHFRILTIEGRLVNILKNRNLVCNITDYSINETINQLVPIVSSVGFCNSNYSYRNTCSLIIEEVNNKLYELTGRQLDISNFKTYLVEVSFNLFNVEHPNLYIKLFNRIFNNENKKNHKNYVKEQGFSDETSFYVKTKSTYKKNINTNYTVNFYDKHNQLNYCKNKPDNKVTVHDYDLDISKNVLRLEVQAYSKELSKRDRSFKSYLDIYTCLSIIIKKYNQFICMNENADFYSYAGAKKMIELNKYLSNKDKSKLLEYIRDKYASKKKFSDTKERKYKNLLLQLNIHPYFIPSKWNIDYLESPIKILKNQYKLHI